MNDTHPTLSIPELMRLLMDVEGLGWNQAWAITSRSYIVFGLVVVSEVKTCRLLFDFVFVWLALWHIQTTLYFLKHWRSGHRV